MSKVENMNTILARSAVAPHAITDTNTQPAAPSPTRWRHSDHPEGGQLLSGEHGPIGTVFTVRDAALIVRAVNEREELIACLRNLEEAAQDVINMFIGTPPPQTVIALRNALRRSR